jgi:hypothetical protein
MRTASVWRRRCNRTELSVGGCGYVHPRLHGSVVVDGGVLRTVGSLEDIDHAAAIVISLPFMLFHCTNAAPMMDIAAVATET